jgi:hypothetical protein
MLILLTVLYVLGGLVLGGMMLWTASHLKDFAQTTGTAVTIKVGSYEVSTGSVLVGLGIVAVAVMAGVPSYYLHLAMADDHVIPVQVKFAPQHPRATKIVRDDGGNFTTALLHVYRSSDRQAYTLSPDSFDPVPVIVWYDKKNMKVMASVRDGPDQVVEFDGESGSVPVALDGAQTIVPSAVAAPHLTTTSSVPAALHNLPDPAPVQSTISVKV